MYSVVLATVLVAGAAAPDHGWRGGCHGCYGVCYGGCYGVCYGGWASSAGCHGCYGCYGGCGGCFGGGGCWGSGCYGGCQGGCFGGCYGGCFGGCNGGCYGGCHGGCFGGCYGCGGCISYVAPVVHHGHAAPVVVRRVPAGGQGTSLVPATLVIKAATDVTVTVNGQATSRTMAQESFQTPGLQVGRTYAYDVVATAQREGKTVTTRKRVEVRAGQQSEVDFGNLSVAVAEKPETARVTVLLPKDGTLFVDGKSYGSEAKQTFDTPKLEQGKTYYYTLKVEVKASTAKTRRVTVEAGKEVTVDFRTDSVASR